MKIFIMHLIVVLLVTSCSMQYLNEAVVQDFFIYENKINNINCKRSTTDVYNNYINYYANIYGVDALLVKSIIQVESNYNPTVISKSNAVGLMQVKANAAGRDAYRLKGWKGEPSVRDLKNAVINIDLGTAYLSILQKRLGNIIDSDTRRYAIIVSYVNGLSALLKIFSINHNHAINKINKLNPEEFLRYVQYHHPSKQAKLYLHKVNMVYSTKS